MAPRAKEFQWKVKLIMAALDITTITQLRDTLYSDVESDVDKDSLLDKLGKYFNGVVSTTDKGLYRRFRNALQLKDPDQVSKITNQILAHGSALELYNRLPDDLKDRVNLSPDGELVDHLFPQTSSLDSREFIGADAPESQADTLQNRVLGYGIKTIRVSSAYKNPDIDAAIHNGHFDQQYLYIDARASQRWHDLTKVIRRYPTFQSCYEALQKLLKSKKWTEINNSKRISAVVVLGAGAAKKDIELIDNLSTFRKHQSPDDRVTYILLDTSFHMLIATAEELQRLKADDYDSFLDLVAVVGDFMDLEEIQESVTEHEIPFRGNGRSLFWMPGNTIANVNVADFVRNLDSAIEAGDILVVGIEFADTKRLGPYTKKVVSHYDHEALRHLVLPHVRAYLDKRNIDRSQKGLIEVRPSKRRSRSSQIQELVSVEIVAKISANKEVILATSSRYDRKSFLSFFDQNKLKLVASFKADNDVQFEQLIFERR